ncbi:short chain dehydrogenase [Hirsutella rhossiliensis]|uniref:Short chain dehydrogenase domain-containing protein n=1 Tax=Hirsutella rhossiliensis TaxID=111463 RepID=A0A9P8N916_9HYPO|nr:short chain dehydrogenase domain-containing protein [Hirsutella rhossiliensis]KAH0966852.1 short chain dehydrogenase domain-containing protein [Hirsutella rhossiliensis]
MSRYPRPPQRDSWFAPLSADLLLRVLNVTLLHPFVCWLIPLCLRARTVKWEAPPMLAAAAWASLVSLCWVAAAANQRIAHGAPRRVDLDEEVIVITGGASGLGMLLAEVYGMRGATVAVLDVRDMENGEARGVSFYKCDVSDKAQVAKAAADIERDLGTPTVLINNAAIVVGKSLLDLSLDEIDTSIATNLLGPFYCLKAFLPALIRSDRGGTIVNVSSVIGHLGAAQLTDYAAAKAGLTALHRSLSAELRRSHPAIRTVLVTPGQLSTPLFYGVETPNSFFAPVVEPVDVAKDIIAAIDGGHGITAAMPLYARWVDWYNVLPVGLQLLARNVSGIDRGMSTFVGRQGIAEQAKDKST